MPTILHIKGHRLFLVSFDGAEPIHVHVRRGNYSAKIWLDPLRVAWSEFKAHEDREVIRIVAEHADLIREKWNEYFA